MKKLLILLTFFVTQLFSLTIALNSAKLNGDAYAVLHIEDSEPIDCQVMPQNLDKEVYLCRFNKIVKTPIEAKKMALVDIDFLEKDKEFYIRIKPKVKSKLVQVNNPLYLNEEVVANKQKAKTKHWSIYLYHKSIFPNKSYNDKIDFPVMFSKNVKPYIGALDLNGAPISYAQSKDINLYLGLKKSYEKKQYLNVIEDSIDVLNKYPNTIFKSEFMLYRLRALDKGLDINDAQIADKFERNSIIRDGKAWIKSFPSDANIPEVLMLIAKSYLRMGFKSDANYFMDILISENGNSPFTKKAILIFADSLYNTRQKDKAIKLYQDVLYSAQDLDIAAEAAIRLSDKELDRGKTKKAKQYLLKVLDANKEYLLKDRVASYALAQKLARNGLYDIAAKVADTLLADIPKHDENKEILVRDSGKWHAKANDIKEAYDRLQQYLKEYKHGDYRDDVQASLDELFFELNETNETKLANYYDELIKKYKNKIGDRAVLEKAKLLLSQERYEDVLKMQTSLEYASDSNETSQQVLDAANALVILSLKDGDCKKAVNYVEKYKLDLGKFEQKIMFGCFIKTARYTKAKELSELHVKDGSLENRSQWLQRYLVSLYRLREYKSVIKVGEDVTKIAKSIKTKPKAETLEMIFFSYMKIDNLEKALDIAKLVEKNSPNDLKNSDVYISIVKRAKDDRNDLLLSEYANKIISLQHKYKSEVYTPDVEFSLIGALQRLEKPNEALKIAKGLLDKNITLKQKVRAYYSSGELSMKLNDNQKAKEYFTKCKDIKTQSSWKDICEQNLKLL